MEPAAANARSLGQKIADRSAVVGVVGLGYVGLPLLAAFHRAGFAVVGFDVDPAKVAHLKAGRNYLSHLGVSLVSDMAAAGRFDVTADVARLGEPDAVLVCVPTPLGRHLEPDLGYVRRTADDLAKALRPGQLVVLESTTYPGTTRDVVLPPLAATGPGGRAPTSSWPTRPSGRTPAAATSPPPRSPSWSAASTPPAGPSRPTCTAPPSTGSCPSPPPRWPRPPSCWRTSTGPSTSPW